MLYMLCVSFRDYKLEKVMTRFSEDHVLIVYLNIFQFALKEKAHITLFLWIRETWGKSRSFRSSGFVFGAVFYPGWQVAFFPKTELFLTCVSGVDSWSSWSRNKHLCTFLWSVQTWQSLYRKVSLWRKLGFGEVALLISVHCAVSSVCHMSGAPRYGCKGAAQRSLGW